jgi:hypothetical protein
MTTIAFDGETLAADRGSWSNGLHQAVRKAYRVTAPDGRRFLVALAGDGAFAMRVLRWMRGEIDHPGPCMADDETRDVAVVIDERRQVWRMNSRLIYVPYLGKVHAHGAGQEVALGALMAGADAVRAIRITMQVSDYAARGIDAVRFKP